MKWQNIKILSVWKIWIFKSTVKLKSRTLSRYSKGSAPGHMHSAHLSLSVWPLPPWVKSLNFGTSASPVFVTGKFIVYNSPWPTCHNVWCSMSQVSSKASENCHFKIFQFFCGAIVMLSNLVPWIILLFQRQ